LDRARKLDRVLALVSQASAAEAGGRRDEALGLYRQAAALDPAWAAASAGVARLQQAAARDAYETQMARGFAAQAGRDLGAAQAAFEAALKLRPGDAQASSALAQVATDRTLARLAELQGQARSLEREERWADALQRYEAALAIDANLVDARQGQERARARQDLDQRLRRELANADHFNDDAVYGKARALLETARGVADPGPVLQQQVAGLDELLRRAIQPIPVTLESDNLTEVTVFKVGRLGTFSNRRLELRPGAYIAVGSRPGFRDVRRAFRVAPGSDATPVVVRCEEPI
jgi:tetratricopeptide (TPR) repeat protein